MNRFPLNSEESELLLLFELSSNLREVSEKLGRDHSVVAKAIKKIAERHRVAAKKNGKWVLTTLGKAVNEHTRAAIRSQISVLSAEASLRIGTNTEFASRVIGPDFLRLVGLFPRTQLTINSYQQGTEAALLNGEIDIGIDCERPHDPDIAYRLVIDEEMVAVASPTFLKKNKFAKGSRKFIELPHLLCERLHPDKIMAGIENRTPVVARFNDLASTRAVCIQGAGWALLPLYSVRMEINQGVLVKISGEKFTNLKYGVWWPRRRVDLKSVAGQLCTWLSRQTM